MEGMSGFVPTDVVVAEDFTVFIGSIGEHRAIYTLPWPSVNLNRIGGEMLEQCEENVLKKLLVPVTFTPRLIYPATDKHIQKYAVRYRYNIETFDEYLKNDDFLKTSWLDNIISNKSVKEKVYFENGQYLVTADYKWDQKSMDQMYLLMIFKDDTLRSIRNLNGSHVGLLKNARECIYALCVQLGICRDHVCLYFHYRPSYFRLHIHIVNIRKSIGKLGSFSRHVFLDDVIRDLEMDPHYFEHDCYYISQCNS